MVCGWRELFSISKWISDVSDFPYFLKIVEWKADYFDNVKGDTETLAGLILEQNGVIPKISQEIKIDNFTFTVESADDRRIKRVKVNINKWEG